LIEKKAGTREMIWLERERKMNRKIKMENTN
jgi:hypothetical protein